MGIIDDLRERNIGYISRQSDLERKLCFNASRLKEIHGQLHRIDRAGEDMFSPVSLKKQNDELRDVLLEEQCKLSGEKDRLERELEEVNKKVADIDSVIQGFLRDREEVLEKGRLESEEKMSEMAAALEKEKQELALGLYAFMAENLKNLSHRIELSYKLLDFDDSRSRMELETARKILRDFRGEMGDMILKLSPEVMEKIDFYEEKSN